MGSEMCIRDSLAWVRLAKKVIADIARRDGNVLSSCFMGTKYKCLRSELPICNKCSVFEENEDVDGRTGCKALHDA